MINGSKLNELLKDFNNFNIILYNEYKMLILLTKLVTLQVHHLMNCIVFFLSGPNDPELLISLFAIQRRLDVGGGWREEMQMGRQTQLRYSYRFVCSEHYYGDSCSRKCSPRDDRFGHYTCTADGYISCLPGWKGEYCVERKRVEGV